MEMRLDGRLALVTGAGAGIGQATCLSLANAGARVVCLDQNEATAKATAAAAGAALGRPAIGYGVDVTNDDALAAIVADVESTLGPVEILVNNAGISSVAPAEELDPAAWRDVPHVQGRLAVPADVEAGRAVFYLDAAAQRCAPADLHLPACAIQTLDDGSERPVIVIQAEVLGGETVAGVRYLDGSRGVCFAAELELLPGPDGRFGR